jgi:hypothetical protein
LKLVPYTLKVVSKNAAVETGASSCSNAKFPLPNKILFLSQLVPVELLDSNHSGERVDLFTRFWGPGTDI